MNKIIDLKQDEFIEIKAILKKHLNDEVVIVFGSRINGGSHAHSDLDIAIKANDKLTWDLISKLRESFENATFSLRVDFMDYHRISSDFQKIIDETGTILSYNGDIFDGSETVEVV